MCGDSARVSRNTGALRKHYAVLRLLSTLCLRLGFVSRAYYHYGRCTLKNILFVNKIYLQTY